VDPGVGTERAALAIAAHGHYFVGPDNGLFTPVLRDAEVQVVVLPTREGASPTFHGRDVFAPAAAALATGTSLAQLGQPFGGIPVRLAYREPHHEGKSVVGQVMYVDRFGTLVTNLTPDLVPSYAVIEVEGLEVGPLRRTFGDVPTGGLVAYVGSDGQVEIAVRDGSAARRLGMGVGGRIRARLG
jgi:S-adenosylmethionine hydrolase